MTGNAEKTVVIAGDVTLDWNLAGSKDDYEAPWRAATRMTGYCQRGGAALLGELVARVADGFDVRRIEVPDADLRPDAERYHHSYALWREHPGGTWGMEMSLGFDSARRTDGGPPVHKPEADPAAVDLAVVDDAGLGFRDDPELWPRAIREGTASWVLAKLANRVGEGPLWTELVKQPERVVVVVGINDLRLSDVQVSRELSWERTAEDLLRELLHNPSLSALAGCAHVIVSFGPTGALLLSGGDACKLFFDRRAIEGTWFEEHPGRTMGYTSCLTAAVAHEVLRDPGRPVLGDAIQRGARAMRTLARIGYGELDPKKKLTRLRFPMDDVAAEIVGGDGDPPLSKVEVRDPARFLRGRRAAQSPPPRAPLWRILEERYPGALEELAEQIAFDGLDAALKDVPLAEFGHLVTVDRQEIEAFRSVRTLILEYSHKQRPKRPLSIAVFGPPGAGKSFGVSEIAESILPDEIEKLTFNLSQLNDPHELYGALHQVRDVSLGGKLPLVFWDEFDSALQGKQLGWLRHFLVPMQDGTFQEGPLTHPIGRAVFVFAGGTRARMGEFSGERGAEFRDAKGPDFVSRLKGFVDVLGPNPRDGNAAADPYYLVRRAILLRSLLLGQEEQLFRKRTVRDEETGEETTVKRLEVDRGVMRGLLQTRVYRHGARSLESIIAMSQLGGARSFSRSALPAEPQLDLHVDAREFLARVQAPELEGPLLDQLAEQMHVVFCEGMLARGSAWNEPDDDYLLRHEVLRRFAGERPPGASTQATLVAWDKLSEDDREQNRGLVRDIPRKLARAGYVMLSARGGDPPGDIADDDVELIAEDEHERWLWMRLRSGWRYGAETDREKLVHAAMLPWTRLSAEEKAERYGGYADRVGDGELSEEGEKWKDRVLVSRIPDVLASAGYTVAKVAGDEHRAPRSESRVVRIGVTGHRFLTALDRVEAGIEEALRRVEELWPGQPLTVVSSLAEGADRLVVRQVLARPGGRLAAVLPLPNDDYMTDFGDDGSRSEFLSLLEQAEEAVELPPVGSRDAAYESGGLYVLDHCDVLLALWDGQGAQGQGGTGGTVAEARQRGLPIAWVHAGNRKPGTEEPTSLGDEQGTVTFENL